MEGRTKHTRKSAPKGRNGCNTCKSRSIRCDETKPICAQCQKSNRICEFASVPIRPSQDQVKIVLYKPESYKPPPSLADSIRSQVDSKAFDFFRRHIVEGLTGLSGSQFWGRTVLKAAHHEPAVLKAITAVTFGYQRRLGSSGNQDPTPPTGDAVILRYNEAISSTMQGLESDTPKVELQLITCALFIYFEIVQMHFEAALQHMSSGIYLYLDWTTKRCHDSHKVNLAGQINYEELRDGLDLVFGRLVLQLLMFIDTASLNQLILQPGYQLPTPIIPATFASAAEAKSCLDSCTSFVIHTSVVTHIQTSGSERQDPIESQLMHLTMQPQNRPLGQWLEAFQSTTFRSEDQKSMTLMEIHHRTLLILSSAGLQCPETIFDAFERDFDFITKSVILFMDSGEGRGDSGISTKSPSFDMGIVPPLYFVATRCRCTAIRSKALQLLQRAPAQEGIWYSTILHKLAERIIALEADQSPSIRGESSSSPSTRVLLLNATIDSTHRTILAKFCKQTLETKDKPEHASVFQESLMYR